ncbi:ABC transporter ATP-binding protein/permease [Ruminococcaceae bacterium OttesenSCG-928-I18]|nr:ABC transporter ATP-binding protein/permease [Ruminococcaceae bacterium OttesenSCG-928-I18]
MDTRKEKSPKRKKGMARLLQLTCYKRGLVILSCILSAISTVISFVPFIAIYFVLRELLAHLSDLSALDTAVMIRWGWVAAGSAVAAVAVNFGALMASHVAAFNTLYQLKLEFTNHIAKLPLGFHTQNSSGKLRKIADENIEKLESFIAHQLPDLAGSLAAPLCILVILFVVDWRLGLASLVPVVIGYIALAKGYGGKRAKFFVQKYNTSLEDMNNASVEYVRGISVVKAFNQTIFSFRKFYETIRHYTEYVYSYTISFKWPMAIFMVVINNIYLFIVPMAIWLSGSVTDYGTFALSVLFYILFSFAMTAPFMKLMYVSSGAMQVSEGISRLDEILDTPPLSETASPKHPRGHDVVFDKVSFSYNAEGEHEALRNVSFTAQEGQITALVGPSGSGKSTLAHLIPRFYDVDEGQLRIGGVDVREMAYEELMQQVSFVFQDVFLFKQSIFENIRIGSPHATRDEVEQAARAAQCHDFIEKLPKGYDTIIGAEGVHLSGGERQRLVIARAILKNTPIIVLDEATAFADPENEHRIQKAFEKLMRGKTVIIIAHRLATVRGADKIVVMDDGVVAETGRHDSLLAQKGRYARMWESYTSAIGWTITEKDRFAEKEVPAHA